MKLALGTAQFGQSYGIANKCGQVSLCEAQSIIRLAREEGMSTLDTAIAYGDSEQQLGEIGVQDMQIVSKLPAVPEVCSDILCWVKSVVAGSLERLRVEKLYALLLHCPQELLKKNGDQVYQALQQVKQDKLVQKIGISIYDPWELDELCNRYTFDLIQAPFSVFDRRLVSSGWLERLSKQGVELHVRSVFLQGLLLMEPRERPRKFERWTVLWEKYDEWLHENKVTPMQACLRYALSFVEIGKVIVGVDSEKQLKEVIQATKMLTPLFPDDIVADDLNLVNPVRWTGFS